MNKNSLKYKKVETKHFIIEITKKSYKVMDRFCKRKGITIDYYLFEFAGYGQHQLWEEELERGT